MAVTISETSLAGVVVIEPQVFSDERGYFLESFNQQSYTAAGLNKVFVQDNHSHSQRGVVRGLHYQLNRPQGKLVYVVRGEIYDVAVDIRRGSPSFGQWVGVSLSGDNHRQLYVPEGFAHGFCVLSDCADVIYKCTDVYVPGDDYGVVWSDETIGIAWPIDEAIVSDKDRENPPLAEIAQEHLPAYRE